MNVLVIGSGIIGITSAYYLSKAGANVTVLEKNPGPAQEASSHNGAQLAWSHVPPLGGPTLFGSLLDAGLVDELFLTLSPVLAGRAEGDRLGLVERLELLPDRRVTGELASVRRHGSHLFLRYVTA